MAIYRMAMTSLARAIEERHSLYVKGEVPEWVADILRKALVAKPTIAYIQ